MRKIIILAVMSFCISNVQAQLFKKLKDKVNQSAKNATTKVKVKAQTAPDRVIDHAANKVETKAESKITNKENSANSHVDKTVDKVDSIKLKKQKVESAKDSVAKNESSKQSAIIKKNGVATYARVIPHFLNGTIIFLATKPRQFIKNEFYNNKKYQA
ncbi:MAG: hypothetical protein ABIP35_00315 [Ginsengibacter sp.]